MFFLFCIGLQSYSDLPWFPWLSIPGSTGSSDHHAIRQEAAQCQHELLSYRSCLLSVGKEPGDNLVCKEMVLITQILVGFLLFILMGFWILLGFVWSNLRYIEGQGHSFERCFKSSISLSIGEVSRFVLTESPIL